LTNGFSKKLDNHVAAVALYVAHYNLCRVHEALRTTPAGRWAWRTRLGPLLSLLMLRSLWLPHCPRRPHQTAAGSSR
jgi:hypothetical protein